MLIAKAIILKTAYVYKAIGMGLCWTASTKASCGCLWLLECAVIARYWSRRPTFRLMIDATWCKPTPHQQPRTVLPTKQGGRVREHGRIKLSADDSGRTHPIYEALLMVRSDSLTRLGIVSVKRPYWLRSSTTW